MTGNKFQLSIMIHKISVLLAVSILLFSSCSSSDKRQGTPLQKEEVILEDYPRLYDAVLNRDSDAIIEFLDYGDERVKKTAWLSLAKTPVQNRIEFLELAKKQDSVEAWFALSFHPSETADLRELEELWMNSSLQRGPVCRYFSAHGDGTTLDKLLQDSQKLYTEKECAFAAGSILTRVNISEIKMVEIIRIALGSDSEDIRKRILYGFYRSSLNSFTETSGYSHFGSEAWITAGIGEQAGTDQFMTRILGEDGLLLAESRWSAEKLQNESRLAIEMARVYNQVESYRDLHFNPIMKLFEHNNPHVIIQLMESLKSVDNLPGSILTHIEKEFAQKTRNGEILAVSLQLLADNSVSPEPYAERLESFMENNVYLTERGLSVFKNMEESSQYLTRLQTLIEKGGVRGLHAVRALSGMWTESDQNQELRNQIRNIVWDVLERKDRSMAYASGPFLTDELIIRDQDFDRLKNMLNEYSLPEDIEVYQVFARVFSDRFREQSASVIDSLSSIGYPPLNRTLKDLGWEIEVAAEEQSFRQPDWQQLYDMGTRPYWVLETGKGKVEIKLDPFTAPATVSAIDSLTLAGAYDGVPFHRVVPNFVVQGGDIELRNGFGGPDFTLPTEPSLQSFTRGAVGIASAGTDTEGSQYFIMHQWSPHLNGNYTLFGNVIRGMEVADRLQEGDRVDRAWIELR